MKIKIFNKILIHSSILFLVISLSSCHSKKKIQNDFNKAEIEVVKSELKTMKGGTEKKIIEEALSWLGTPYRYGGSEKGKGTDCSGMVWMIFKNIADIKLPRNSAQQADFCKKLKKSGVKPGDLVFFATGKDASKISHVGIMLDNERFIHASTSKGVVISEVSTPYYQRTFKKYGRVPKK